ncbi:hypothetical protein C809_04194 [Lachnospiraceae bacterium MD335]|nr:hypothetical protein C809_04194 [Lachnospiraceae bacterium MD335]
MMEWLKHLKVIKIIALSAMIFCFDLIFMGTLYAAASEFMDIQKKTGQTYIGLEKLQNTFETGMLDLPKEIRQELMFYQWISEALDHYASESGDEEVFNFDVKRDILYGSKRFRLPEMFRGEDINIKSWVYSINHEELNQYTQDSYQFRLEGTDQTLYAEINLKEGAVHLYPESEVVLVHGQGDDEAYKLIKENEYNEIEYYPDFYVESDWDDMEVIDDHFAGVSLDEVQKLDYLKIPDDMQFNQAVYLSVASVLKRYMEENQVDDVFYYDAEKDNIACVTNMIFTCRLRGNTRTIYMDIDAYNMKCHVYEVEE